MEKSYSKKIRSGVLSVATLIQNSKTMYQAVAPPQVTVTAGRRPQQIPTTKDNKATQGRNINVGFGGKRKEQLWQCVEGCSACCKLAKGPSFASPEEIFQNTSDIEVRQFISYSESSLSWNSCSIILWFFSIDLYGFYFMNFSSIKAWLAQMDGAFTTRKARVNAPFMPVRLSHLIAASNFDFLMLCMKFEAYVFSINFFTDRPYFCRVESPVFEKLYGIRENKFNKAACRSSPLTSVSSIPFFVGSSSRVDICFRF